MVNDTGTQLRLGILELNLGSWDEVHMAGRCFKVVSF